MTGRDEYDDLAAERRLRELLRPPVELLAAPAGTFDRVVKAARARRRFRLLAPVAAAAAVVVAIVVVAQLGGSAPPRARLHPVPPAQRSAAPAAGFVARDLTWVSTDQGWLLASALCGSHQCSTVLHTADSGHTWTRLSSVAASRFAGVRFVNDHVGYLFGATTSLTTDGGRTWHALSAIGHVRLLEPAAGTVLAVTGRGVEVATPGSPTWRKTLTIRAPTVGVYRNGTSTAYAVRFAMNGPAQMYRSTDGGFHWRRFADPCPGEKAGVATDFAAGPADAFGVLCTTASHRSAVLLTFDAGHTWGPLHWLPPTGCALEQLAVPAAGRAVVADGTQLLFGPQQTQSWQVALRDGCSGITALGFQTPTVGHLIVGGSQIYGTTDGGRTWSSYSTISGADASARPTP